MGKYTPLQRYLEELSKTKTEIQLSFTAIENILQDKLPPAAHDHRAWWANEQNGPHVQAKAWIKAGWKVDIVNFQDEIITFIRFSTNFSENPSKTKVSLHEAMELILNQTPMGMASSEYIQRELERLNLYKTKKGEIPNLFQISARARNYSDTFEIIIKLRK